MRELLYARKGIMLDRATMSNSRITTRVMLYDPLYAKWNLLQGRQASSMLERLSWKVDSSLLLPI